MTANRPIVPPPSRSKPLERNAKTRVGRLGRFFKMRDPMGYEGKGRPLSGVSYTVPNVPNVPYPLTTTTTPLKINNNKGPAGWDGRRDVAVSCVPPCPDASGRAPNPQKAVFDYAARIVPSIPMPGFVSACSSTSAGLISKVNSKAVPDSHRGKRPPRWSTAIGIDRQSDSMFDRNHMFSPTFRLREYNNQQPLVQETIDEVYLDIASSTRGVFPRSATPQRHARTRGPASSGACVPAALRNALCGLPSGSAGVVA